MTGRTPADRFDQAAARTATVLSSVAGEQLDQPTGCTAWTVRELGEHIVESAAFFASILAPEESLSDGGPDDPGAALARFAAATSAISAALAAPGGLERTMELPTGPALGIRVAEVATGEMFVHGWDLAAATGQETPDDDDLAAWLLASGWPALCDEVRRRDPAVIAPAIRIAADRPPLDRLLAFLGRDPDAPSAPH